MEACGLRNNKRYLILDTNVVMSAYTMKINIISELKDKYPERMVCVIKPVERELRGLLKSRDRKSRVAAKVGIKMIEVGDIKVIETPWDRELYVDEAIIKAAENLDCIVCTQDKKLRKRLEEKRIPVIYIRKKQYIEGGYI